MLTVTGGTTFACDVGSGSPTPETGTPQSPVSNGALREIEREVREGVNQERIDAGLKPLEPNPTLADVARDYSCRMAEEGFFAHESPDGETVDDRVRQAGVQYRVVGENLARLTRAPSPAEFAVSGWMESEGHRENILREEYSETGVGVCRDGDTYFFTQVFLVPR